MNRRSSLPALKYELSSGPPPALCSLSFSPSSVCQGMFFDQTFEIECDHNLALSLTNRPGFSQEPGSRKGQFHLLKGLFLTLDSGTSSARNENLRPLRNTNIPHN